MSTEKTREELEKRVRDLETQKTVVDEVEKQIAKKLKYKPRTHYDDYVTKPDDDMSVHGWKKAITVKYLTIKESGKIFCQERDFYTKDFSHECGSNEYLWFCPSKESTTLCCTYCKTAESAIHRDHGILRKEYEVTAEEAYSIMKQKGYRDRDRPMAKFLKQKRFRKAKLFKKRERPPQ